MDNLLAPCTGLSLTPSHHGKACKGNGDDPEYECCCDECDYYLNCFPDWNAEDFDRKETDLKPAL